MVRLLNTIIVEVHIAVVEPAVREHGANILILKHLNFLLSDSFTSAKGLFLLKLSASTFKKLFDKNLRLRPRKIATINDKPELFRLKEFALILHWPKRDFIEVAKQLIVLLFLFALDDYISAEPLDIWIR